MDSTGSDRPQRRTALVRRELGRYGIKIAALSETRFAKIGEIKEVGAGYTFFWSGRKSEERREAGVGFAIKSDLFFSFILFFPLQRPLKIWEVLRGFPVLSFTINDILSIFHNVHHSFNPLALTVWNLSKIN